jgi:large subunit ribosomal protein L6
MSRVGNKPIPIPQGVDIKVSGNRVEVKGPKGSIQKSFHPDMKIILQENQLIVQRPSDNKIHRALHGMTRSLLFNMVSGVTEGFQKVLQIEGVGYRALKAPQGVTLQLGFSHPVEFTPPEGIEIIVETPTRVVVKGISKEDVGQVAAEIRSFRKPNPYTGKGIRYEGEWIRRKTGKTGIGVMK